MTSCIGAYPSNSCYNMYMTKITEDQFGKEYIDNLVKESVALYVKKHPKKIFDSDEHTDWTYKGTYLSYTNDNDLLNQDFFKGFTYPKDYDYTVQKYNSSTVVILNLDEKGNILGKKKFQHNIYNEHNKMYIPYFEKEIDKFIKSTKFAPIKYRGYPVKCEISFFIYYK